MRQDGRLLPVLTLCLGVAVFSLQDLVIKLVAGVYPVHEVILIRCLAALPVLLPIIARTGGLRGILSPRAAWLALRGVVLLGSYTAYYLAFPVMKLADILALFAAVPLCIAALARPALGERIGARGWTAVGVGFAGALVMLQPGAGVFAATSLLPLFAALTYAISALIARQLARTETAPVMAFYQTVVFLLAAGLFAGFIGIAQPIPPENRALAFLLRGWAAPGPRDLALMALCGPVSALGMTLLSQAYRIARQANQVAPFEYTGLIWATFYGYTIWGEVPGLASALGAALIVGGGIFLITGPAPAPPRPAPEVV
jgi:drug/metabolite transporter (DMT)-like permease